jgi:hypothetical protein
VNVLKILAGPPKLFRGHGGARGIGLEIPNPSLKFLLNVIQLNRVDCGGEGGGVTQTDEQTIS